MLLLKVGLFIGNNNPAFANARSDNNFIFTKLTNYS